MHLNETCENTSYIIEGFEGDVHFENRVSAMGIRAGVSLKVIRNQKKLPVLIYARDTLIAIGRNESEKIKVGGVQSGN